jgi:hypothetical protein
VNVKVSDVREDARDARPEVAYINPWVNPKMTRATIEMSVEADSVAARISAALM